MNAIAEASPALELQPMPGTQVPAIQPTGAVAINSPAALMLQAMAQGASLEQVEKMMDLQERWEKREAEKAFNAAVAAFKSEAIEIIKRKDVSYRNGKGGLTEYSHAELADVVDAVTPHLSKHGLSIGWKTTKQEKAWVEVTCTLKHSAGHSDSVTLGAAPDDSGGKNAIQAIGSAVTYLERYTAKAILGVAERGQDNDGRPEQRGGSGGDAAAQADEVLAAGEEAAKHGMAALTAWWSKLDNRQRGEYGQAFTAMRKKARAADEGAAHG